ncbi:MULTISPECIES: hypothetical protein [Pseudoalteromonas]|uniref:hypothetical protein n=1 Tax=Pseudoalteromonas TaxID=53246 RepID=UPI0002D2CC6E|nr:MULTISPECIES: hypothetical protein [Pseudoalteromonas]MCF6145382.1 hypothetical protein [Pseudoalteromonas mariniglutinosa NCIMB 1770]
MSETKYLKVFLDDIGHSVHCMNTIAVSLSKLTQETAPPKELNISWKPGNVNSSSINARRFAIKSSIVYSVESLFEYLSKISKDYFWPGTKKNFNESPKQNTSKADRVTDFLTGIPFIEKEWIILTELLCHWRNKVVHANSSNACISKSSKEYLEERSQQIFDDFHHFDVNIALDNFGNNKFTLKDVTTLITMLIKCARAVDAYFISTAKSLSVSSIHEALLDNYSFQSIVKQQEGGKRYRQSIKWVELNYGFLGRETIESVVKATNQSTLRL